MARIFKQQYTVKGPDGEKQTRKSRKWYFEYRDGQGIRRRRPGYVDKHATQQLAAELARRAIREECGITNRNDEQIRRPLLGHLDDWRRALLDTGASANCANLSRNRVKDVLDGTGAKFWKDLDANRVSGFLADLRKTGRSIESSNHYLRRMKQFSR